MVRTGLNAAVFITIQLLVFSGIAQGVADIAGLDEVYCTYPMDRCQVNSVGHVFKDNQNDYNLKGTCHSDCTDDVARDIRFTIAVKWLDHIKTVVENLNVLKDGFGPGELTAKCPKDPVLYGGDCSNVQYSGVYAEKNSIPAQLLSRRLLSENKKAALRSELEKRTLKPKIEYPMADYMYGEQSRIGDSRYFKVPVFITLKAPYDVKVELKLLESPYAIELPHLTLGYNQKEMKQSDYGGETIYAAGDEVSLLPGKWQIRAQAINDSWMSHKSTSIFYVVDSKKMQEHLKAQGAVLAQQKDLEIPQEFRVMQKENQSDSMQQRSAEGPVGAIPGEAAEALPELKIADRIMATRVPIYRSFSVTSPPDKKKGTVRLNQDDEIDVVIVSPKPVGFNITVDKVMHHPFQFFTILNEDKSSDIFRENEKGWRARFPITLERDRRYELRITLPEDAGVEIGRLTARFQTSKYTTRSGHKPTAEDSPKQAAALALAGKHTYRPNEKVVFTADGDPGQTPVLECLDQWDRRTKCPEGIVLRKTGGPGNLRYHVQAPASGRYRLRVGKVLSEPFEVKMDAAGANALTAKPASSSAGAKTPAAASSAKTAAVPMAPKTPPKLSLSKKSYTGQAKVKAKVAADKAFKVEYVLEKNISGKFETVDESNKPEFKVSAPGNYQVRARYVNGNFSAPVAFTVISKQSMTTAPVQNETTPPPPKIPKKKALMKQSQ